MDQDKHFFRRNLPELCSGTSTYGTRLGIQSKEINQSKQRPWVVCGSREDGVNTFHPIFFQITTINPGQI